MRELGVPVTVARELDEADAVVTLRNYYSRKPSALRDAESNGIPIYVLKTNTMLQMENMLASLFDLEADPSEAALRETAEAIGLVQASGRPMELGPAERLHPASAAPDGGAQQHHVALPRRASRTGASSCSPTRGARGAEPARGKFITLEGSEGSGKTTAARHLGEWLRSRGEPVLVTREPGGTPLGDEVRRLVLHLRDVSDDLDPRADALLYAASRGAAHGAASSSPRSSAAST